MVEETLYPRHRPFTTPLRLLLTTLCFALQSAEPLLCLVQLCPYSLIGPLQLDVLGLCLQLFCSPGLQLLFQLINGVMLAGEPHPSGAKLTPSPLRLVVEDPKAQVNSPSPKEVYERTPMFELNMAYLPLPQSCALQLLLTSLQLQLQVAPLFLPG